MHDGSPDGIVPTRKEAAALLGITEKGLSLWTKEPWFPASAVGKDSRGRNRNWNVDAIRAARDAVGRKGSDQADEAIAIKIKRDEAELRIKEAKAREAEREEQRQLGNILDRDEYEAALLEIVTVARDRLLTLPGRLAKLPSIKNRRQFKASAEREITKLLESFAADVEHVEQRMD